MSNSTSRLFGSFFFAGFECTTGFNVHGEWIDQIAATQHDARADEDYGLLRAAGLTAAREGIRWPLVDRAGRYDFSGVRPFFAAARKHGIEVIWDLFHFGYPIDVDLFADSLPERFAEYCHAAARVVARSTEGPFYFTPVNEPSYLAWAAGEMGLFAPHAKGRGWELKTRLVRAAVAGIDAIRAACPGARIVNADPICRVAAPVERPDRAEEAESFNRHVVFQSWDMLSGRLLPELGGSPEHLDIVGINYYWTNQWELGRPDRLLAPGDPRHVPLRELARRAAERYGRELLVTETSHCGPERAAWVDTLLEESESLAAVGVPLRGVCLYPVLGMPEWHDRESWTCMGLWDLEARQDRLARIGCRPMLEAVARAERRMSEIVASKHRLVAEGV
jgi:hypothetical protein